MKYFTSLQNKPFLVWLGGVYGLLVGLTIAMAAQITFLKFSMGPIKSITLLVWAGGASAAGSHLVSKHLFHEEESVLNRPLHYVLFFSLLPILILILSVILFFTPN
ncbi:MAG TPA: hypothetical protein VIS48_01000 [Candidatus Kryptonia bacterium]